MLVFFKMEGCPYCQPLLRKDTTPLPLSSKLVDVRVADANADAKLSRALGVASFPTIALVQADDRVDIYQGPRKSKDIEAWVTSTLRR